MNRTAAIAALMTVNHLGGELSQDELLTRARCLVALGVTREEMTYARQLVARAQVDELRAKAAEREANMPSVNDWLPEQATEGPPDTKPGVVPGVTIPQQPTGGR